MPQKRKGKGKKALCMNFLLAYNSIILTGYDNKISNVAKKNYMYLLYLTKWTNSKVIFGRR